MTAVVQRHLDDVTLLRLVARESDVADERAAKKHLESCPRCRGGLATARRLDRSLTKLAETLKSDESRNDRGPGARYFEFAERLFNESEGADEAAERILRAARADGAEELPAALRALDGKPYRGFALLYAAQRGTALVAVDPRRALTLAEAIHLESASLAKASREARATLLMMGDTKAAQNAAATARPLLAESGDLGFGSALCDYFEGEAATFGREYVRAEQMVRRALNIFEEFGQDQFVAKAEAAIGTILENRGDHEGALSYFDRAIAHFDPERDARALTMTLNNRANSLARLNRLDQARGTYAKALNIALRNDFGSHLRYIRTGLAELDFLRGQYGRALRAFRDIASESLVNGSPIDVLFARLYVAECLGRTGKLSAMTTEIEALRRDRKQTVFSPSPALGELFVCLDQGTIDADLIAHVREYLQDQENGVKRPYRSTRHAGRLAR